MEKLAVGYKFGAATVGAFVSYFFGGWSVLLEVLVAFVILDYLTGFAAGGKEGKLSSRTGYKGIPRKLLIFVMIGVAHYVDRLIGEGHIIRDATLFFYLSNELLSILENVGRAGLPVPPVIKQAVAVLQGKGERNGNRKSER